MHDVLPNRPGGTFFISEREESIMAQKKLMRDLTVGRLTPVLLQFAIPVMLSNLLQTAYNMADMVIVGKYVSSAGLSAVSVGGDVMHFYMFLGMGFATAGQIMISQYVGAGKREALNEVIGTLFSFVFLLAAGLGIVGALTAGPFLDLLNAPPESRDGALAYTVCSCLGMVFIFGYNTFASVLRGMGDSRHPMIFICLAAVLNIVLDLLFIAVLRLEAFGAALATVMSQGVSFLLCLGYLYRNREDFGFDFRLRSFRISRAPLQTVLRLGIPIAIQSSAGSISTLFVASFVNPYGVVTSAVSGIGAKLNSIALIVANAMNVSGAAVIGQNFGAGRLDRVRGVFFRVFLVDLAFVSTLSVLMLSFPEFIFGMFDNSAAVLAMAPLYAPVAAISFMGFAFRSPSLALINGLGHSKINFLMGIIEGFVLRIGLTLLLGVVLDLGVQGFWYGSVIASYGYGIVVFPYFFSGQWKKKKSIAR